MPGTKRRRSAARSILEGTILDRITRTRARHAFTASPAPAGIMPSCPTHADSLVRRYRTQGAAGPGVYPQCVPADGNAPHLLEWQDEAVAPVAQHDIEVLTASELDVLTDAANGLTRAESAAKRCKGTETVKTQRRSILLKLGARNMAQAVALAHAYGSDPL